jgi:hypothetical protein
MPGCPAPQAFGFADALNIEDEGRPADDPRWPPARDCPVPLSRVCPVQGGAERRDSEVKRAELHG